MKQLTYSCVRPWRDVPRTEFVGKGHMHKSQGITELGKIVQDSILAAIPPEGILFRHLCRKLREIDARITNHIVYGQLNHLSVIGGDIYEDDDGRLYRLEATR